MTKMTYYNFHGMSTYSFEPPLELDAMEAVVDSIKQNMGLYPSIVEPSHTEEHGVSALTYRTDSEEQTMSNASTIVKALGNVGVETDLEYVPAEQAIESTAKELTDRWIAFARDAKSAVTQQ
jgi:hypothetical protein